MIHNRKARVAARRSASKTQAEAILQEIATGRIDPWEGYRQVYGVYVASSGLLEELKPLFQLPGIVPDGCMTIDDRVRETAAATKWLAEKAHP